MSENKERAGNVIESGKIVANNWTPHAKRTVASMQNQIGGDFVKSAVLLQRHGGSNLVQLHLIAQGIELVFKSLLMFKAYDKYMSRPSPNKPNKLETIGHDLVKAARALENEEIGSSFDKETIAELEKLNKVYKRHNLRYVDTLSLFGIEEGLKADLVVMKAIDLCKQFNEELKNQELDSGTS